MTEREQSTNSFRTVALCFVLPYALGVGSTLIFLKYLPGESASRGALETPPALSPDASTSTVSSSRFGDAAGPSEVASSDAPAVNVAGKSVSSRYLADIAEIQLQHGLSVDAQACYLKAIGLAQSDKERTTYRLGLAHALESGGGGGDAPALWAVLSNKTGPVVALEI